MVLPHHVQERSSRHIPLVSVANAPHAEPTNRGPNDRAPTKGLEMGARSLARCAAVAGRAELAGLPP